MTFSSSLTQGVKRGSSVKQLTKKSYPSKNFLKTNCITMIMFRFYYISPNQNF